MTAVLPDVEGLSDSGTHNHYFYEIENRTGNLKSRISYWKLSIYGKEYQRTLIRNLIRQLAEQNTSGISRRCSHLLLFLSSCRTSLRSICSDRLHFSHQSE